MPIFTMRRRNPDEKKNSRVIKRMHCMPGNGSAREAFEEEPKLAVNDQYVAQRPKDFPGRWGSRFACREEGPVFSAALLASGEKGLKQLAAASAGRASAR